ELRPVLGSGRFSRSRHLWTEGLAVLHAPDTKHLRCRPCRSLGDGKGSLRGGALGRGQDRGQADLSAERGRAGASRPGVAQDRGLDGAHAMSEATPGPGRANPTGWNFWEPQSEDTPPSAGHASALKVNNSSGDRDSSNMRADMPFGEPFG